MLAVVAASSLRYYSTSDQAILSQMVEATCPGYNPGGQPPMSDAIIGAAEEVQRAAREGADLDWVPDVPNAIGLLKDLIVLLVELAAVWMDEDFMILVLGK